MVRFLFVSTFLVIIFLSEMSFSQSDTVNEKIFSQIGLSTSINSKPGYFNLNPFTVFSMTEHKYWRAGIYYEHASYEQDFFFQPSGIFVTQNLIGINPSYNRILYRDEKANFWADLFLEALLYHEITKFDGVNYGPINIDGFSARLGGSASFAIKRITIGVRLDIGYGEGYETKSNENKPGSYYFFHVDRRGSLIDEGMYVSLAYNLK